MGNNKVYVFCARREISRTDLNREWITEACPDYPSSIPDSTRFQINNFTYTVTMAASRVTADEFVMSALNEAIYPITGKENHTFETEDAFLVASKNVETILTHISHDYVST